MNNSKVNFTLKYLDALTCPDNLQRIRIQDSKVAGLYFRVTVAGAKNFSYYRRLPDTNDSPRKLVEITIGKFDDVSIEQARLKATEFNHIVGLGRDPTAGISRELTYDELFVRYINEYARLQTNTWEEAIQNHRRYFVRWKNLKVRKIRRVDIQSWLNWVCGEDYSKKHTANRSLDQMKAVINFGRKRELISCENPCLGIDKFPTKSRERFIQPGDEFARFAKALSEEPNEDWQDFFWLSLFVAARRANVLSMAWCDISFELETWTIPITKNGDSQSVPLTPNAMEILQKRYNTSTKHPVFVFPSDRKSRKTGELTHLKNPKEAWRRILCRAGISDLRIHDLRRTAGSYMAIQGVSPTIIGKALGHRSASATAMYARLTQDPVRQALINAQNVLLSTKSP